MLVDHLRHSGLPFLMMASIAALAVSLWSAYPPLLLLLAGPLLTLGLYQRYAHKTRVAWQAAETDWLTGLGNRRAYEHADPDGRAAEHGGGARDAVPRGHRRLQADQRHARPRRRRRRAGRLSPRCSVRSSGVQAFRLGGDEFAVVVDGDADAAVERIQSVQESLREPKGDGRVTISIGIASCPQSARDETELQHLADRALYWTKKNGKSRWCVYSPSSSSSRGATTWRSAPDGLPRRRRARRARRAPARRQRPATRPPRRAHVALLRRALLQVVAFPTTSMPWSAPDLASRLLWLVSYGLLIAAAL